MISRNAIITIPDFKEAHMKMSLDLEGKSFISAKALLGFSLYRGNGSNSIPLKNGVSSSLYK